MTGINHAMTGAVIAVAVKQPVLVLPLAFASHYVLDSLPHFGLDVGVLERNRHLAFKVILSVDILLIGLALIFIPQLVSSVVSAWLVLAAMLAAMGPDFVWVYRYIKEMDTKKFVKPNKFNAFHAKIQFERRWGLVVEIVYLSTISLILKKLV